MNNGDIRANPLHENMSKRSLISFFFLSTIVFYLVAIIICLSLSFIIIFFYLVILYCYHYRYS